MPKTFKTKFPSFFCGATLSASWVGGCCQEVLAVLEAYEKILNLDEKTTRRNQKPFFPFFSSLETFWTSENKIKIFQPWQDGKKTSVPFMVKNSFDFCCAR